MEMVNKPRTSKPRLSRIPPEKFQQLLADAIELGIDIESSQELSQCLGHSDTSWYAWIRNSTMGWAAYNTSCQMLEMRRKLMPPPAPVETVELKESPRIKLNKDVGPEDTVMLLVTVRDGDVDLVLGVLEHFNAKVSPLGR